MKKVKHCIYTLILISFFTSCKDDTGEFSQQIYTNGEMVTALKSCLTLSMDTANAHLAVPGGFSENDDYAIKLSSVAPDLVTVLNANGEEALVEAMEAKLDSVAENSGSDIKEVFAFAINAMTFPDAESLLFGKNDAITQYFSEVKSLYLIDHLQSRLKTRMTDYDVIALWKELIAAYNVYSTEPVMVDLSYAITRLVFDSILSEMIIEEQNIRKNPEHRTADSVKSVFSLLD